MIASKPLRIAARLLIILLWFACALADVIIVDDPMTGFAILIATAYGCFKFERFVCGTPEKPFTPPAPEGRFWVQYADGHYFTITDETAEGIKNALTGFKWEDEVAKYNAARKTSVPPGIGLGVFGEAHFVHITSTTGTSCDVLYVRNGKDQIYKPGLPLKPIGQIIAFYMLGDAKKLLEALNTP